MKLTKTESAIIMALKGMLEPFKEKSEMLFYLWGIVSTIQNNDRSSFRHHAENIIKLDDIRKDPANNWKNP